MSQNRQIAKNSIILYVRLLITTLVGLYTSRIILLELGTKDYGLYAIVGGIVALINLMGITILTTSNRFLAVEVGKKENNKVNEVFNRLLILHIFFSFLLVLLTETIGTWYVINYLNVGIEKIPDAIFILRLSVLSSVLATLSMPYQSLITTYEKFSIKVAIEIISSLLNLGAVLLLIIYTGNKLRAYALYVFYIQIVASLLYFIYCKYNYIEIVKWRINREWNEYKEITRYFGWQMVYVAGAIGYRQGGAIILNLFFGTVVNAAFAIAAKVNEFVFSFVKNLNQAAVPQIMKSYSGGGHDRSLMLIYRLSKYTYFLMLIPGIPLLIVIDNILIFWLKDVPIYTSWFVVLNMIAGFVSALESGFDATIDATGKIRKTKIIFTILFLSTLPIGYLFFKISFPPYSIIILSIVAEVIFAIAQILILINITNFQARDYFKISLAPVIAVTLLILPQYFLRLFLGEGLVNMFLLISISLFLTSATIFLVGLNNEEKMIIRTNLVNKYFSSRFSTKKYDSIN